MAIGNMGNDFGLLATEVAIAEYLSEQREYARHHFEKCGLFKLTKTTPAEQMVDSCINAIPGS